MKKYEIDYSEERKIKKLFLHRKVVKVENNILLLDNGTELEVLPNEGCAGCPSGRYSLVELNECENAITNVEVCCDTVVAGPWDDAKSYKIFVFAENKKIKLLQVDGDDGNGYYGSGYSIIVKEKRTYDKEE